MPIYEYECSECGVHFDRLQRFGDPVPDTCPNGHPRVHRLLSQPAIVFKGPGFYVTDNGRNSRPKSARSGQKAKATESASDSETEKQSAS